MASKVHTEENEMAFDRYKYLLTTYPYDFVVSHQIVEQVDKSVTILLKLSKNGNLQLCYNLLTMEDVQKMYQEGSDICFDKCYIDNFDCASLSFFDAEQSNILLNNFSADCAFFDGNTNFSGIHFKADNLSFLASVFEGGEILFDSCVFYATQISFEKMHCGNGSLSFSGADFGDADVSFLGTELATGEVLFNGARFGQGSISFKDANLGNGDVSFVETNFGAGPVSFENARFGSGEIWFGRAIFDEGKVSFEKADFGEGNVTFWETNFGEGAVTFNKARFGDGEVSFCGTSFGDEYVWFDDVDFGTGSVSFMGTNFGNSDVRFYRSNFEAGDVTFFGSTFGDSKVRFWRSHFGDGEVNFTGVMAAQTTITFKGCNLLNHEVFRFDKVKTLEIIDCIIDGVLLLNTDKIEAVQIEELSFLNTKNLGSIFLDWETAKNAIANYSFPSNEPEAEVNQKKANQLKMLKENFHHLGEYDSEDEAFAEYMNYRRKTKDFLLRFPSWVLSAISGYGTKPFRLFITMILVMFFFGFIFSGQIPFVEMMGREEFGQVFLGIPRGLYFSMITFMTIGYGDISPANELTAFLAGLEGFAGLFLMSYFTVAVVRKTLR